MAHHLRLDLDLVELLARIDTNDAANHFRHDNHVSQVCLDKIGLLIRLGVLLRFAQFLDQAHGATLQAAVESTASAGVQDVEEFGGGDIEESVWQRVMLASLLFIFFFPFVPLDFGGRVGCLSEDVLIEINASVREFAEGSLLLELGGLFGIL